MNMLVRSSAVVAATALPTLAKSATADPVAPPLSPAATSNEPTRIAKLWAERNAALEQVRAAYRVVHQIDRKAWRRAGPVNPAIAYSAKNDRLGLERWGRDKTPYIEPSRINAAIRKIDRSLHEASAFRGKPVILSKQEARRKERLKALLKLSRRHDNKVRLFLDELGCDEANRKAEALMDKQGKIELRILRMRSTAVGDLQIKLAIADYYEDGTHGYGEESITRDLRRLMQRPALAQAFEEA